MVYMFRAIEKINQSNNEGVLQSLQRETDDYIFVNKKVGLFVRFFVLKKANVKY